LETNTMQRHACSVAERRPDSSFPKLIAPEERPLQQPFFAS
jgi:hypothetical protein